ncbi:MAG: hypothetical protein JRI25_10210 [Deltaproteobacteria bacterium]|nr:hypothetical protein [Deltaproteobacteria bacterium]
MRPLHSLLLLALATPSAALAGQLVVTRNTGVVTEEGGEAVAVWVSLSGPPYGADEIPVGADDSDWVEVGCNENPTYEIWVDCSPLFFDATNWDVPQAYWVHPNTDLGAFGPDTPIVDGDREWSFDLEIYGTYVGFEGAPQVHVSGTNLDKDSLGIYIYGSRAVPESSGGQIWSDFTLRAFVLTAQPTSDVHIEIRSSDWTEGGINPAHNYFTFTPGEWNSTRSFSLVVMDDPVFDGDRDWAIVARFESDDPDWDGLTFEFPMTTLDDEGGGLHITPTVGLVTDEALLDSTTFDVVLVNEPWRPVEIGASPDDTEGVCDPETVVFDATNWDVPQSVTVTAVDDQVVDGDVTYDILVEDWTLPISEGPELFANPTFQTGVDGWTGDIGGGEDVFSGNMLSTLLTNYISVEQTVTGLEVGCEYRIEVDTLQLPVTDEFRDEDYYYRLQVETWDLNDADNVYGWDHFYVVGLQSSMYMAWWPETVFRFHIDGVPGEATQDYQVDSVSLKKVRCPTGYELLPFIPVEVTNLDDDVAGFEMGAAGGFTETSEDGGQVTLELTFDTLPMAQVVLTVIVSDPAEASTNWARLVVDATNWQAVTDLVITGLDDSTIDGDQTFSVAVDTSSSDSNYDHLSTAVVLTNLDDDVALVEGIERTLQVTENGSSDTVALHLAAQPSAAVTVDLLVSDTTEGTVTPASLVFDATTWNLPQAVTVTGLDDDVDDGTIAFQILTSITTTDAYYTTLDPPDLDVVNTDDDVAAILVSEDLLVVDEEGGTATFEVVLTSEPTAAVDIAVTSNDEGEGTVSPAALTFTATDWDIPQEVVVTGVDDEEPDGNLLFAIDLEATSDDQIYDELPVPGVHVSNLDDDGPRGTCSCATGWGGALGSWPVWLLVLVGLRRRER